MAIEQSQIEEAKRLSKLQKDEDEQALRVVVERSKSDTSSTFWNLNVISHSLETEDLTRAKEECWQYLQQGIALLDQGKFQESLPLFTKSIGALSTATFCIFH